MASATEPRCPECNSQSVHPAAIPGLASCNVCGHVFAGAEVGLDCTGKHAGDAPDDEVLIEVPDEHAPVPDEIEAAWGWRAWGVKERPGAEPILQSVTHAGTFWTPRTPTVATCDIGRGRANGAQRKGHEVPCEHCSCGLYSAKTLDHLMSMHYHAYDADRNGMFHVIGKVKLWGKVIEGTQGWRAEFGYPAELYVPYEAWKLASKLEKAYGVEVFLKNTLARQTD